MELNGSWTLTMGLRGMVKPKEREEKDKVSF